MLSEEIKKINIWENISNMNSLSLRKWINKNITKKIEQQEALIKEMLKALVKVKIGYEDNSYDDVIQKAKEILK